MNRNAFLRALGRAGVCALLALGLAACGGGEPAPVVQPPAPPPFQPQPVEVALGSSSDTITLMTTEDGGFTLNGESFASGSAVAADYGNRYLLTLDGGQWTAAHQADTAEVPLGITGETVTLTVAEDGAFWIGDMTVESGAVVMSSNGNSYALAMDESGWTATYQAAMQTVALGAPGVEITVAQAEDGTWTIDGLGPEIVSGMQYPNPATGNLYLAEQDANGVWTATFVPVETPVALGASGTTLVLASTEAGGWTRAGEAFGGGSHVADNGNVYTLTLVGGVWSAAYVPDTMAISGTGLTATPREDGSGYDVTSDLYDGTASLGADGAGDVTLGGTMFHVNMDEDGNIEGARFAAPIESPVLYENLEGTSGAPSLSGDDRSTSVNEAGVTLTASGTGFSAGSLLSSGAANAVGGTFVASALSDMIKLRDQVATLVDLFNDGGIDRTTLTDQLIGDPDRPNDTGKWGQAQAVVDAVFNGVNALENETNPRRVVSSFDALVDALSSEDAFIDATAANGGGVFEGAELSAADAAKADAQVKWEATAVLGQLGDTRFGAAVRGNRNHAEQGAAKASEQTQAFAYARIEATRRASDVQVSGNAYYEGVTHAVDAADTPNLYVGDVELQVRFTRGSVSGLVSNLETVDGGEAWSHGLGGAVERIFLDDASLRRTGAWSGSGRVRLSYEAAAGGARDNTNNTGTFAGRRLGRGDEAGEQAIGTCSVVGTVGTDSVTLLAGGFGAQRAADR